MAHITTDTFFDAVTLTASAERITIANGATLTVRASNSASVLFPGTFDVQNGTLLFSTTAASASAPIIFYMSTTAARISCSGNGVFAARGGWHTISSSSPGTADQNYIVNLFPRHSPPFVRVETGPATDQWRYYLNYGISGVTSALMRVRPLTSQVGAIAGVLTGHVGSGTGLGEFFEWNESTSAMTFGNGLTGDIPPAGARIQCPNIMISTTGYYPALTAGAVLIQTANTGIIDLDTIMFSDRVVMNALQPKQIRLKNVGIRQISISECYDVSLSGVFIPPDRTGAGNILGLTIANATVEINNSKFNSWNNLPINIIASDPVNIKNTHIVNQSRGTAGTITNLTISNCNNINIFDSILNGGQSVFTTCNDIVITGISHANMNTGVTATPWNNGATDILQFSQCSNINLRNIQLIAPLSGSFSGLQSAPRNAIVNTGNNSKNIYWTNYGSPEIDCRNTTNNLITIGVFTVNTYAARINAKKIRTAIATDSNASLNTYLRNITATGWPTGILGEDARPLGLQSINLNVQGINVSRSGIVGSWAAVYDSNLFHVLGGSGATYGTTGLLWATMVPQIDRTYFYSISGTPRLDNNGILYVATSGDICELQWDYKILGVESFLNHNRSFSGNASFASNVIQEYALKPATATDFYPLKVCTTANFISENLAATANKNTGFYLKFRFTATASNANNTCLGYGLSISSDKNVLYPVGYVPLELQNVVSGSQVWAKNTSTNEIFINETVTGGSSFYSVPYNFDDSSVPFLLRIRKSTTPTKYLPFETQGSYNKNGATIYVSQIEDTIAT